MRWVTWRAIHTRPSGKPYKYLKLGESVQNAEGEWIHPEDVLGPARPGRRLCLLGDTCDSIGIAPHAMGADVLVHESTFAAFKHSEAIMKAGRGSNLDPTWIQPGSIRSLVTCSLTVCS